VLQVEVKETPVRDFGKVERTHFPQLVGVHLHLEWW
jgi:hypothetical protein